jgi:two-component system KDP operon response regulator KdpE
MPHTILIVEDNKNIRRFLRTTLEIEGYRALEASTVQESLERIDQELPDLVLLDLMLPDGSGWDFIAAARSHTGAETRSLPIVVLTASADLAWACVLVVGATAFSPSPFLLRSRWRTSAARRGKILVGWSVVMVAVRWSSLPRARGVVRA